jgi:hypothetical protein
VGASVGAAAVDVGGATVGVAAGLVHATNTISTVTTAMGSDHLPCIKQFLLFP